MSTPRKVIQPAAEIKALRARLRTLYSEIGEEPDERLIDRTVRGALELCLEPYAQKELVRILGLEGILEAESED